MPIEFRCSQCDRLLRVPDEAAGKNGKCPGCQAIVKVPDAPAPPPDAEPLSPLEPVPIDEPLTPLEPTPAQQPVAEVQPVNPFGDQAAAPLDPYTAPQTQQMAPPPAQSDDPWLRWIVPVGKSPFAVISALLGLLSLACCPMGPIALVLGIVGIVHIRKKPGLEGTGRAIIGILLGLVGTIGLFAMIIAIASDM